MSVMELMDGFGDPDDAYKRKIKKGAHCVYISVLLALLILTLLAHGNLLKHFPPAGSLSELVRSSHKLADLLGSETTPVGLAKSLSRFLTPPSLLCNGISTTSKMSKFFVQKSSVLPSTSAVRLRFTGMRPSVRMR